MMRLFRFYGVRRTPALFATSCMAVALATFAASSLSLLGSHAGRYGASLLGLGNAVVYLKADATKADAERIAAECAKSGVQAKLVSPESNTQELARLIGESPQKLASFSDLLGWTIELTADDKEARAVALAAVAEDPAVEVSDDGSAIEQRAEALGQLGTWLGRFLMLGVLLIAVFVINITVSLALVVRRDELQIQRIVGADDTFVLAPFWVEAGFTGLLGGALGMAGCAGLVMWMDSRFAPTLERLGLHHIAPPSPTEWLQFVAAAVVLSLLGTTVAGLRQLWALE